MLIERKSPLTGETNSMEIDVTWDEIEKWRSGTMIQVAMPNLTPDEREFIMTGYTAEDWAKMFPPEDKGDYEGGDEDAHWR